MDLCLDSDPVPRMWLQGEGDTHKGGGEGDPSHPSTASFFSHQDPYEQLHIRYIRYKILSQVTFPGRFDYQVIKYSIAT